MKCIGKGPLYQTVKPKQYHNNDQTDFVQLFASKQDLGRTLLKAKTLYYPLASWQDFCTLYFVQFVIPMGISPMGNLVAFPKESQQQQSAYPTLINNKVHAWSFRVSIIHQTLSWSTGSGSGSGLVRRRSQIWLSSRRIFNKHT